MKISRSGELELKFETVSTSSSAVEVNIATKTLNSAQSWINKNFWILLSNFRCVLMEKFKKTDQKLPS